MAQARGVFLGEHIPFPALGGFGILGDIQPHGGVGKLARGLAAVGEQIEFAVSVDIRLEHAVDADDFVLGNARLPGAAGGVFIRLLKPHNEARLVPGADEIRISIPVHIHSFAMDKGVVLVVSDDDLFPIWRYEQSRFATSVADDIDFAVSCEIGGYGDIVTETFPNDVAFPVTLYFSG